MDVVEDDSSNWTALLACGNKQRDNPSFEELPAEVWEHIIELCGWGQRMTLIRTCHLLHALVDRESLWQQLFHASSCPSYEHYSSSPSGQQLLPQPCRGKIVLVKSGLTWKQRCMAANQQCFPHLEDAIRATHDDDHIIFIAPGTYNVYTRSSVSFQFSCNCTHYSSVVFACLFVCIQVDNDAAQVQHKTSHNNRRA